MGTVKYTGPVASFHCPTNAEIRSLKVHFSPKQEGSGDPSPENVREIVGWDGVVVHNETDYVSIPEEYQRVEWIKSTGTQYIDTNILFNHGIKISAHMGFAAKENSKTLFGVRIDAGATRFLATYYQGFDFAYWNDTIPFEPEIDHIYDITFDTSVSKKFIYGAGGRLLTTTVTEIFPNLTGYIFAYHRGNDDSVQGMSKSYFQSMHIENASGDVLFNGYACYHKSSNVAGIYDTVTQTFFTNQGTGEFICGPDIGETVEYEFGTLGKNKFDYTSTTFIQGIRGNDGEFVSDSVSHYTEQFIPVIPATEYTLSGNNLYSGGYVVRIYYSDANKNWISKTSGDRTNALTFTTPSDCYYIQIQTNSNNTNPDTWQLELGSIATAYEPYDPNKTVYGGWVDLVTGEVQEDGIDGYPYCPIVLNGTEEWALVKQDDEASIFKYNYGVRAKVESNSICSHFQMILPSYTVLGYHNGFVHGMSGNLFIQPTVSTASTVEEFKSYLASQYHNGTPVTILFQANKVPNIYFLAPTQLQTFLAQNNIWSNADYVEVEYDLHETQDILNRKAFIIANQPHIIKPAAASLQNFKTDLAAPLKECKVHFTPVQEGTGDPSPENVRAISGLTGVEVRRCGKNLIDESYLANANNYPNAGNYGYYYTDDIQLVPNTRYRFVWYDYDNTTLSELEATSINLYVSGASEYIVNNADYRQYSSGFTTPATGIIRLGIYHPSRFQRQDILDAIFNNGKLLLQVGTDDIAYEPYSGTTLPINWTTEAGTVYGGYIDLISGEVWADTFLADPNGWTMFKQNNGFKAYSQTLPRFVSGGYRASNIISTFGSFNSGNMDKNIIQVQSSSSTVTTAAAYVSLDENIDITTLQYVSQTNIPQLVGTLDPITLKTLRGTNNIWANTSNGNIELAYWSH